MVKNFDILRAIYIAHGVYEEGNNLKEWCECRRWLSIHKHFLNQIEVKLWEALAFLEIFAFNFDTIEEDIKKYLGLDDIPF